jgi:NodT family efflux transporter outer membrane factor (OMF) lipoprotein
LSQTWSRAPFWRELGDSTLTMLIEEAERANADVQLAHARLTSARASRRLAAFDLAPTITASGSATRQQLSMAQVPGLGRQLPQQELWDVGFDASWELDIFGRVNRTVRAQSAVVASAEHSVEDVQVTIAAEVARTYFELRGAQRQLAVSMRNAENQRHTVKLTEDRLAAGRGTAFDRERARSVLFLTLATTPVLESQIAQRRSQLAVLLGRAPDALPKPLADSGALPRLPDTLYVGSPAELVRRRPDVLRAERQLAAQSLFVGAARADYLPRLTLGARAGYAATTFDSLSRAGTSRLLVGPVVSWPLFDLGRVRQRVSLAQARESEAEAEYRGTTLRALEETDAALVAYDRAHARLAILEDAVRASTRAADLAQQRFEAGLTDFLQVLDAQRTLLDAENQLAQGHTTAATALVAVYKALGGTWPTR